MSSAEGKRIPATSDSGIAASPKAVLMAIELVSSSVPVINIPSVSPVVTVNGRRVGVLLSLPVGSATGSSDRFGHGFRWLGFRWLADRFVLRTHV
ncbi:MAG: hypothetical protein R3C56_12300 [Pirellulaceae bacterium]